MRILIIQKPTWVSIDGIRVDCYEVGQRYDLGSQLAAVFLAEGWGIPVDEPATVMLFSEADPFAPAPFRDADAPPNLSREHYPPYLNDRPELAQDFERRSRSRRRKK